MMAGSEVAQNGGYASGNRGARFRVRILAEWPVDSYMEMRVDGAGQHMQPVRIDYVIPIGGTQSVSHRTDHTILDSYIHSDAANLGHNYGSIQNHQIVLAHDLSFRNNPRIGPPYTTILSFSLPVSWKPQLPSTRRFA
jgi:hypothetical protein